MSLEWDGVVALDYGQFYLHVGETDPELAVEVLALAQQGDGIALKDGLLVVMSPHQYSFRMGLRVEVWSGSPEADLDDWQEAFEVHLDVDRYGVDYESPTVARTPLPVPTGSYHALITGRGFVARDRLGSTTPGDAWRLRFWPGGGPVEPRRLRRFAANHTDSA